MTLDNIIYYSIVVIILNNLEYLKKLHAQPPKSKGIIVNNESPLKWRPLVLSTNCQQHRIVAGQYP